ncbi:MAG: hypothetical protein JNL74_12645, partial [Fibrobacteres bacterium]|nr:hypothetical protein [Fibrobacterota bacterium]
MIRLILLAVTVFNVYIEANGILQQNLSLREYWGVKREQSYVSGGIPLPKGLITNAGQISLSSPAGSAVPFQSRPLLRWPDGSLRWLLMTFPADVNAHSTANYKLTMQRDGRYPSVNYAPGTVAVTDNSTHVIVSTGKMILQIKKQGGFNLFDRVTIDADNDGAVDDEIVSPSRNNGAFIRDMYDTVYTGNNSPSHEVKIEESGPLQAIIRISGNHSDGISDHRFYGYLVRIYVNAGQSEVRVQYTMKNSYFKPRGVLAFKSMLLRVKPNLTASKTVTFYDDSLRTSALQDSAYVYQPWPFGFETKINGSTLHTIDTADKSGRTLGWM